MKVRDLFLVAAFVLGCVAVSYWGDAIKALREYEYTSPLCVVVETAWADASGSSRTRLEAELVQHRKKISQLESEQARFDDALAFREEIIGEQNSQIERLKAELDIAGQVQATMSGELAHCRQLIDSQEAVVKEVNWRYGQLTRRIQELGRDDSLSGLVRE